jgi:hypothetical protein
LRAGGLSGDLLPVALAPNQSECGRPARVMQRI